jgi:hypothetical protein
MFNLSLFSSNAKLDTRETLTTGEIELVLSYRTTSKISNSAAGSSGCSKRMVLNMKTVNLGLGIILSSSSVAIVCDLDCITISISTAEITAVCYILIP